jgi:phospholipase C
MIVETYSLARASGNEIFPGNARYASGPIGLGVRVPMIVISPWSKGGWVNSEVFDHTSLIRFIEQRFARESSSLIETNITKWRRAVVGDLTSAFDFRTPNAARVRLPGTTGYAPTDHVRHDDYVPVPPAAQTLPKQEPGVRPARAVPYDLNVHGEADLADGSVKMRFENSGRSAAVFQVRSAADEGPFTYTVGPRAHVLETFAVRARERSAYDFSVYGPNGFFREYKGSVSGSNVTNLDVSSEYDSDLGITLGIRNRGNDVSKLRIVDTYGKRAITHALEPGKTFTWHWPLLASFGWYDLTVLVESDASFAQRLAGHVETGRDGLSDPALGT